MSWRYKGGFIQEFFNPLTAGPTIAPLWSFGRNQQGDLGIGNAINTSSPTQVGSKTTWLKVAGGYRHASATQSNGTLWGWGNNGYGQLGQNNTIYRSSPVQVGALTTWLYVSCGTYTVFSIDSSGYLWACGKNLNGELGLNNKTNLSSPIQIGTSSWASIVAAKEGAFSVAKKTDGSLWSWGANGYGQLGQNNIIGRSAPVQIGALTTWLNISAGYAHAVASKTDGTLWIWGYNNNGQLGQNDRVSRSSPTQIGALTTWLSVGCQNYTSMAIKTDGTLWAWGNNQYGNVGDGNAGVYRSSPVQVGSMSSWQYIDGGKYYALGATISGLYAWGINSAGQLGQGDTTNRSSPAVVKSNSSWVSIGTALFSSFAIENI